MTPPNSTAKKLFVSSPVRTAIKRIKQILDPEYKKIKFKSIIMYLNYLKEKNKNSLLESLQKYKKCLMES